MSLLKNEFAVLTPAEMAKADALAIAGGVSGAWLMENAGHAVKAVALETHPEIARAVILCGPGNNGGDGYVTARLLSELGIGVAVFRDRSPKEGTDAEWAAALWRGGIFGLDQLVIRPGDVVIDGLYGAGFEGALRERDEAAVKAVNKSGVPVISIDLPSGVSGLTGQAQGAAIRAERTVTFFCKKPGHLLYPGRGLCGTLSVADIGISGRVLDEIAPNLRENGPDLFDGELPSSEKATHKYARGHAGVFSGGPTLTGAARLSAMAAARAGAGAVTLFAPSEAMAVLGAHMTSVMLKPVDDAQGLLTALSAASLRALVIGPGFGRFEWLEKLTGMVLASKTGRGIVLDADVFSAFAAKPQTLFAQIKASASHTVMTPHEGEFGRVFPDIAASGVGKHDKARAAAERSGAVVLFKGPDTVIAAPDGRAAVNINGGPELATAGSGDVLAGIIAGLMAQGMPAFEAACAGAWKHGEAGRKAGQGAVAEDLVGALAGQTA